MAEYTFTECERTKNIKVNINVDMACTCGYKGPSKFNISIEYGYYAGDEHAFLVIKCPKCKKIYSLSEDCL